MRASKNIIELIKKFEGFRARAYQCPAGYKTIGYGHLIANDTNLEQIDDSKAEELLYQDIDKAEKSVLRNIIVELTQGQFDALISFTFNLGGGALQRSSLRQKINRREYEAAPKELMRWVYTNGIKLPGLVKRRQAEVAIYLGLP